MAIVIAKQVILRHQVSHHATLSLQTCASFDISHTQMARYEIKNIYPPADVLKNLSEVFSTTIDFLVMGDTDSKAQASLSDAELINQFKKISALPDDEKSIVLKMITAYIRDFNTQQAYAS